MRGCAAGGLVSGGALEADEAAERNRREQSQDQVGVVDASGADRRHQCEVVAEAGRDSGATVGCSK